MGQTSDRQQVAKAKRQQQLADAQAASDLRHLMEQAEFRRFAWRCLERAGMFRQSLHVGQPDMTGFCEGQRAMGLWLLHEMQATAPDAFLEVIRQHGEQRKRETEIEHGRGNDSDG